MSSFADRMRELIGTHGVSAFARKVGLGESLIRKYLNGSEPSLARANQIAEKANCSLEWLASGVGYQYRKAELVDIKALDTAISFTCEYMSEAKDSVHNLDLMKLIIANYQFLRSTKKADGHFELAEARRFAEFLNAIHERAEP